MKRPLLILAVAAVVAALLAVGFLGGRRHATHTSMTMGSSIAAPDAAGKVLYWYDPMMPEQHFDKPGLSPMGMEMVPKYASSGVAADVVRIDPATVQNLGVRTALVERRTLSRTVTVPGTVSWDLREASTISARVDAVITRLQVRAPYTMVTAGEPLAELLAPQWNSALAEYEALQGAQSVDAKALRGAARQRLEVLGLSAADIRSARSGRGSAITLHAPQTGMITALEVREGQRVSAGQALMTVNGLDSVWIEAALPQAVAGTVQRGTPVTVHVDALPGQTFDGTVETLLPDIDSATRTQPARIVLANPQHRLSPGMFATVQLSPADGEALPLVPDDALIATGQQTRVIVAEADGHFRPLAVRTGRSADGYTEILEGLHGGEKIVVSGQFLIDSEASLSGALERVGEMDAPAPAASTAEHAGHAMPQPMPAGDHP
ncbi:MAG TPA: efflux RND transporter periplasmic adaptor subunit [Rhodanobacter sp.]